MGSSGSNIGLSTRPDSVFETFYALWRAILRSNSKSRRTLIHAQRANACILCLTNPRYLVLLFLVWKQYWKIVASTLFRFLRSSNGMDSTSLRVLALAICSRPKYLQHFFPSLFSVSSHTGLYISIVSSGNSLDINIGNNVGLTLFITSLSDVGTEAFHFLAGLATILGIGIVGVLHALCADQVSCHVQIPCRPRLCHTAR